MTPRICAPYVRRVMTLFTLTRRGQRRTGSSRAPMGVRSDRSPNVHLRSGIRRAAVTPSGAVCRQVCRSGRYLRANQLQERVLEDDHQCPHAPSLRQLPPVMGQKARCGVTVTCSRCTWGWSMGEVGPIRQLYEHWQRCHPGSLEGRQYEIEVGDWRTRRRYERADEASRRHSTGES